MTQKEAEEILNKLTPEQHLDMIYDLPEFADDEAFFWETMDSDNIDEVKQAMYSIRCSYVNCKIAEYVNMLMENKCIEDIKKYHNENYELTTKIMKEFYKEEGMDDDFVDNITEPPNGYKPSNVVKFKKGKDK